MSSRRGGWHLNLEGLQVVGGQADRVRVGVGLIVCSGRCFAFTVGFWYICAVRYDLAQGRKGRSEGKIIRRNLMISVLRGTNARRSKGKIATLIFYQVDLLCFGVSFTHFVVFRAARKRPVKYTFLRGRW